ncbi:MAG: hypothetical protein IJS74_02810 [Clostridia bacterium]|nr:hypothetical protein [Clostridia bacterium]
MIFIISGPSGVGKTPIIYSVIDDFSVVRRIQSYTSRDVRRKEVEGTYIYLTKEDFEKKIDEGFFLEYNKVHKDGHYYGTALESYQSIINEGGVAIKDIDVDSYKKLKESGEDVVGIYLTVKNKYILMDRLRERGESEMTIKMRLFDRRKYEDEQMGHFDYVVYTDDYDSAEKQVKDIVKKELDKRNIKYTRSKVKKHSFTF